MHVKGGEATVSLLPLGALVTLRFFVLGLTFGSGLCNNGFMNAYVNLIKQETNSDLILELPGGDVVLLATSTITGESMAMAIPSGAGPNVIVNEKELGAENWGTCGPAALIQGF